MDCSRAEELFSDDLERTLGPPLSGELLVHLAECPRCRAVRRLLPEVVTALRELGRSEPQLPAGLAARIAARSFTRTGVWPRLARDLARPGVFQAAAVFLAAVALYSSLSGFSPASTRRFTARLVERSANTGAYLLERKDRLVEEVRFLNVVLGTAFEERVDKVSERVLDYRRQLKKRPVAASPAKSGTNSRRLPEGAPNNWAAPVTVVAGAAQHLPNPGGPACVQQVEGRAGSAGPEAGQGARS